MDISWRFVWLLTFWTKCYYTQRPCWLLSTLEGSTEGVFYLKSYFWGLRKNFVTSPYFLKSHTHFELRPVVTQIALSNNKCLQSTLESKHTVKIKRCIVSPEGHLSPYSDFKKKSLTCEKHRTKNVAVTAGRRETN